MALTTTANVKALIGIPSGTTTFDDRLGMLVTRISAIVTRLMGGRELELGEKTQILNGSGRNVLRLKHRPIVSITSCWISATQEWTAENAVDVSTLRVDGAAGLLYRLPGLDWPGGSPQLGVLWPEWAQAIKVVYQGGYAENAIPGDVQLAIELGVIDFWQRVRQVQGGQSWRSITAESILGSQSATYAQELAKWSGLPAPALEYLRPYIPV